MDMLATVAEQKIREAMARGEFANLAGAGKPLVMEDYSGIPEELRMAYTVLKNAGCVPPELELRKQIVTLQDLLSTLEDGEERRNRLRELNFKLLKLNTMRRRPVDLEAFPEYRDRLYERLAG